MRNKYKSARICALSFFIPAVLMLLVYVCMGMAPFGDKNILSMDMADQYVDFFCGLKSGDVFFSWTKSMGTAYAGVFSYYVSSPLSVLTLLVPNAHMPVALLFLTVLKIGLAGMTFGLFLRRSSGHYDFGTVVFCVCYALMSWSVAYSMCIMWLDGLIWLPVILIGVEDILAIRRQLRLGISLVLCFLSTWYISYMIGIFAVLYLLFRILSERKDWKTGLKMLWRLIRAALYALAVTAWLWLPALFSMTNGKLGDTGVQYAGLFTVSLPSFLQKLLPGAYDSLTGTAAPFLFCSILVLLFCLLYFFIPAFSKRERIAAGGLLLLLLASMFLSPLDRIWHFFQYPNWFPFRYSFLLSVFAIILAHRVYIFGQLQLAGTIHRGVRGIAALLLIFVCVEMSANALVLLQGVEHQFGYGTQSEYRDSYAETERLVQAAEADAILPFSRIRADGERSKNESIAHGYNGITHYSSAYNSRVNAFLKRVGMAQTWLWSSAYGSTVVTDALLNIGYVITDGPTAPEYTQLLQGEERGVYRNPYALPVCIFSEASDITFQGAAGPLSRQDTWLRQLSGSGEEILYILPAEGERQGERLTTFVLTGTGAPIYADLSSASLESVYINGEFYSRLGTSETRCVHDLGAPAAGETMVVTLLHTDGAFAEDTVFYSVDLDAFNAAVQALQASAPQVEAGRGSLRVFTDTAAAGTLFTTVPAENGWRVYIDGVQTDTAVWEGTFLRIAVPAGKHTVLFQYTPPGLLYGLLLGAAAVLLYFLGKLAGKLQYRAGLKKLEEAALKKQTDL